MRLQLKHDTESNWNLYGSKVLLDGEIAVVHMNDGKTKLKVGDGTTQFKDLNYVADNFLTLNDLETSDIEINSLEVNGPFTLNNQNVATENYVTESINNAIGIVLQKQY